MARLKRLNARWAMKRKMYKFVTTPRGAHSRDKSLPLITVVRGRLGLARNSNEARKIITSGGILVDGDVCRDHKRGLGLFDSLEVAGSDIYKRVLLKGVPVLVDGLKSDSGKKICKITGKGLISGGKVQLRLHDGRNIVLPADEGSKYNTKDSLLLKLPEQKIETHLPFKEGVLVLTSSKTKGLSRVKKVEGTMNKRLWLEDLDGNVFEAPLDSAFVVGTDKPAIDLTGYIGESNE